ncbi:prion-inhibition and propagation-domain-containing protein [Pyrenochaeta sp. MPI-SDFR-AT-0127]|nr:prion-inhibition and propagation-domain-containing protein [Pyrenochaeta sp. MPI-SDFR-AT-0127]
MVLPVDPVALTTLTFTIAAKAWTTFKTALNFSDDASDLILRLDLEQARFHLWSSNAGYKNVGDSFDHSLLPVIEFVDLILKKLTALFEDAEQLRIHYGLTDSGAEVDEPKKLQRFILSLNKALNATQLKTTSLLKDDEIVELHTIHRASTLKKIKWGMRDKIRFQELVEAVETYVHKLTQLLNESQQKKLAEDRARHEVIVVGSIEDVATLTLVSNAAQAGIQDVSINNICGRLTLSDRMLSTELPLSKSEFLLPLTEFSCSTEIRGASAARLLTQRTSMPDTLILLEKKTYPIDISQKEFGLLSDRIERIVMLLRVQRGDVRTLRCIGYTHDRPGHCWWMAFEYSTMMPAPMPLQAPVSLLDLFADKTKFKPPLEARIMLARSLASSISGLFNSSWLHKSIRSDNILFPQLTALRPEMDLDMLSISSPFLTGFEYSRQRMELSLGKPQSRNVDRAIYRHPFYQGQNPGSYRIEYDMYSLGLLLVEIARWMPLSSFLDNKKSSNEKPNPLDLSSKMETFTEANAKELQKRVLYIVDKELAFRVGTPYRDAVRWCLTQADEKMNSEAPQALGGRVVTEAERDWRPALNFFNNVVVPLERLIH